MTVPVLAQNPRAAAIIALRRQLNGLREARRLLVREDFPASLAGFLPASELYIECALGVLESPTHFPKLCTIAVPPGVLDWSLGPANDVTCIVLPRRTHPTPMRFKWDRDWPGQFRADNFPWPRPHDAATAFRHYVLSRSPRGPLAAACVYEGDAPYSVRALPGMGFREGDTLLLASMRPAFRLERAVQT